MPFPFNIWNTSYILTNTNKPSYAWHWSKSTTRLIQFYVDWNMLRYRSIVPLQYHIQLYIIWFRLLYLLGTLHLFALCFRYSTRKMNYNLTTCHSKHFSLATDNVFTLFVPIIILGRHIQILLPFAPLHTYSTTFLLVNTTSQSFQAHKTSLNKVHYFSKRP